MAEAQQLLDVVEDPLFKIAFAAFIQDQRAEALRALVEAVRKSARDTMFEARQAGYIEALETLEGNLRHFAAESMKRAQG